MTSQAYNEYMQSTEWRVIRSLKLEAAGDRCEHRTLIFWRCNERRRLEVHHRNYRRLGRERPSDLKVLCKAHHRQADNWRKIKNRIKANLRTVNEKIKRTLYHA